LLPQHHYIEKIISGLALNLVLPCFNIGFSFELEALWVPKTVDVERAERHCKAFPDGTEKERHGELVCSETCKHVEVAHERMSRVYPRNGIRGASIYL
jgi:hypothetical protein